MPNCDFYAAGTDHRTVLEYVFEGANCDVFESYSRFDQTLRQFRSLAEIEEHFLITDWATGATDTMMFQLYPRNAEGRVLRRDIKLNADVCGGATFRQCIEGWGLVQLYLTPVYSGRLRKSHTNHNSEKRAIRWSGTYPEFGSPSLWNWANVTSFSQRLVRYIKKIASSKVGSRPILPNAATLQSQGIVLARSA